MAYRLDLSSWLCRGARIDLFVQNIVCCHVWSKETQKNDHNGEQINQTKI